MPNQRVARIALTALLGLAASCDRGHPPAVVNACNLTTVPVRLPPAARVVAIGDLHGDLGGARAALRAAGAIDASDHWIGGQLVVIQLGDVLDRGDDESQILALLERLDGEAHRAGGAVVQLLGNHELMNAAHDFRYVTPGGMHDFDGDRGGELGPGGMWAKRLARHNVVAIAGDTVLSHAGVLEPWAGKLDELDLSARCWLDGQGRGTPAALTSDDSPVWTRAWGGATADCAALDRVLAALAVKRMVVAHTVQDGGITSACDGRLWRIDVGLAKLYGGPIEVLELGDPPKILKGSR